MKQSVVTVAQAVNDAGVAEIVVTIAGANEDGSDMILTFNPALAHATINAYAAFHGFKQRFVDAAAMSKDTKDGSAASPATKAKAIKALIDWYETGTDKWSRVSEGGPKGGFLFEALCKAYGHMKAPSEIRAWLDGLSAKEEAALREDDTIAPVIAALKAAKAKPIIAGVDTKGLLAGLTVAPAPADALAPEADGAVHPEAQAQ